LRFSCRFLTTDGLTDDECRKDIDLLVGFPDLEANVEGLLRLATLTAAGVSRAGAATFTAGSVREDREVIC
jgi:hypothetical protein